jgi:hypothetical protein
MDADWTSKRASPGALDGAAGGPWAPWGGTGLAGRVGGDRSKSSARVTLAVRRSPRRFVVVSALLGS